MNEQFTKMEGAYNDITKYYSEDAKTVGPDEFFAIFKNFVESVGVRLNLRLYIFLIILS